MNMSADFKARFRPIFRRAPSSSSTRSPTSPTSPSRSPAGDLSSSRTSKRLSKGQKLPLISTVQDEHLSGARNVPLSSPSQSPAYPGQAPQTPEPDHSSSETRISDTQNPTVIVERPTPERGRSLASTETPSEPEVVGQPAGSASSIRRTLRPNLASRRHSPLSDESDRLFSALYKTDEPYYRPLHIRQSSRFSADTNMPNKKIWVKRPGSSPTQVTIGEDDLVDDVRDMVIRKYANSLGRNFDSPDVTLRLVQRKYSARHSNHERLLGPEEVVAKIIEVHYPGGQTVEEALIIDVPQRRTPKHSPRIALPYYMSDNLRPGENGSDYFPPMAVAPPHSPQVPATFAGANNQQALHRPGPHSIAVLETGQLPDLPSPGSRMTRHSHRPRNPRTHTTSPTVLSNSANPPGHGNHDNIKVPPLQPTHTPPVSGVASEHGAHPSATTPPRVSSPRLPKPVKRNRKSQTENQNSTARIQSALLDNSVPPINVLIVEDNIINLKLLEAFLKRLKVRWSTAMNGKDAVSRWRDGGFHLVLMDIQLPVMNGLDATKEIRRLERVNDIGVFTNSPGGTPSATSEGKQIEGPSGDSGKSKEDDTLANLSLFKSSVIIVALTASSLQSDRHEALAAGCNDFLTKPVSFDWLSRKVMEWGCMQALIDFDGWRKWKNLFDPAKRASISMDNKNADKSTSATSNGPSTFGKVSNTDGNAAATANATSNPVLNGASKFSTSPTTSRQARMGNNINNSSSGANGAGPGKTRKFNSSLNGIKYSDVNRERNTSSEDTGTGTGTDTNGEEGSGAETTVGA